MLAGLRAAGQGGGVREGGVPPPEQNAEASGKLDSKVESKVAEESLTASDRSQCLACHA